MTHSEEEIAEALECCKESASGCPMCGKIVADALEQSQSRLKLAEKVERAKAFEEVRYYLRGIGPEDDRVAYIVDEFCTRKIISLGFHFDDERKLDLSDRKENK